MLDRASTFSDPEIVKLLQTRFITVAIDQAYQRRQQDAEGEFYRQIAGQGPRNNFQGTTQGLYVGAADGGFLGFTNHRHPDRVKRMLDEALEQFQPVSAAPLEVGELDPRYATKPPAGGLVVQVTAKVLGGYPEPENASQAIFQTASSRDNLWIRQDEHEALVRGELPETLQRRIARYHLVDNTRGEPPMWSPKELQSVEMSLADGQLSGSVHLETASGERGYQADLLGFVEVQEGRVTRLDIVAKGDFWGEGPFTRNAPPGKFPLAVAFTLATGADQADRVPPQGSRGWLDGYLRHP